MNRKHLYKLLLLPVCCTITGIANGQTTRSFAVISIQRDDKNLWICLLTLLVVLILLTWQLTRAINKRTNNKRSL